MEVDTDKKDQWLVYFYEERHILSNILFSLARYKKKVNGWPRKVGIRRGNRLQFTFGDDTK
ncbi:MAG: hypothetical protein ACXABD_20450, partial [Candidatus Thorarchaeota archaeon]